MVLSALYFYVNKHSKPWGQGGQTMSSCGSKRCIERKKGIGVPARHEVKASNAEAGCHPRATGRCFLLIITSLLHGRPCERLDNVARLGLRVLSTRYWVTNRLLNLSEQIYTRLRKLRRSEFVLHHRLFRVRTLRSCAGDEIPLPYHDHCASGVEASSEGVKAKAMPSAALSSSSSIA